MKFIIGVDPGASGAVAILNADTKELIQVFDMPSVELSVSGKAKRRVSPELLAAELRMYAEDVRCAFVEQVSAMPGQGVSSMFAFGQAFGIVLGVMAGLGIPVVTVPPVRWKRDTGLNSGKDASRQKACSAFPLHAKEFARVRDDGRAESVLIALWGIDQ